MLTVIWLLAATSEPASQPASQPAPFLTLTDALQAIRSDAQAGACLTDLPCWKGRALRLDGALTSAIAGLGKMQVKLEVANGLVDTLKAKVSEDVGALTVAGSTMKDEAKSLVTPWYREPVFVFTMGMLTAAAVLSLAIEGYNLLAHALTH